MAGALQLEPSLDPLGTGNYYHIGWQVGTGINF